MRYAYASSAGRCVSKVSASWAMGVLRGPHG
jgi:hypothetical protein